MCLDFQRYQKLAKTVTHGEEDLEDIVFDVAKCEKTRALIEEQSYKGAHHLSNSMQHPLINPKQLLIDWKRLNCGLYEWSRCISNLPFKFAEAC